MRPSRTNTKKRKDVLFIIGIQNAKAGSKEIPGLPRKFGRGVQNEAGQRLTEFCCQENTLVIANTLFQNIRDDFTHGHHQMVNTQIKLIAFFVAENGEAVHSQQKQDRELTVAQIMNLIAKFRLKLKKVGKMKSLMIIEWK